MKHFLVLLLMLFSPAVAAAQSTVTGSIRSGDAPATLSEEGIYVGDAGRAFGDKFATCVINRHSTPAAKALSMVPDSAEQYAALHRVFDSECLANSGMNVQLDSNPISFRSSLYKAFVRKLYAKTPLTLAAVPIATSGRNAYMIAFADCVVRLESQLSLRLILAVAGTSAERAVINGLKPQMAQCLMPGNTVTLTKSSLSAAISEAYYREATAARLVGAK